MLRIPCVAVVITNSRGEVLLQLRDNKPGLLFANHWTLPGGRVESGETPEEAAYRELREEIGLELPLAIWKTYDRLHPEAEVMVEQHIFVGQTDRETHDMLLGEGQALRYFKPNELASQPIAFGFGTLLKEFFTER